MTHLKNTTSLLALLALSGLFVADATAQDTSKKDELSLVADHFEYSQSGTVVSAKGAVNIMSSHGKLWADRLVYNTNSGEVVASGNVVYVNEDNITLFLDSIELDGDLKAGVLKNIRVKMGELEHAGPRLAASEASRTAKGVLSLKDAVYSPCKPCAEDDTLPWRITASEIEYDAENSMVSYEDAALDIYGVPVAYMPYFKHSIDNTPASGLLAPRFGSSTRTGFETKLAYYQHIAPNHDATARLRLMTDRGAMLGLEHRLQGEQWYNNLTASAIEDDLTSSWRSHIQSQTEYVFKPGRRAGLNLNLASDDTYLDDFFDKNPSHLASTAYLEDASKDHYYAATATFYQDQKVDSDDGKTAQVLPQFIYEKAFNLGHNKSHSLTLSANAMSLYRSEGTQYNRLVTDVEYRDVKIFNSGDKFDFRANIRTDLYQVNTDTDSSAGDEGTYGRFLPQISLQWERPFISATGYHKMTPMAMLVLSPRGGNPDEIPNEDSVAYELDTSNLFDANRFAGYDRIESGPRFIYGVDNVWGNAHETQWRIFVGQSYRMYNDSVLPDTGGTETKVSDWVGLIEAKPHEHVTFSSKFRIDNSSIDSRRLDNIITIGDRQESHILLTHSQLDGGPEEMKINGRYHFNEKYSFEGEFHRDLTGEGRSLNTEGQITYTDDCYKLSFKARRRGFDNRNVPPSTDYLFNVELLTLGSRYN